MEHNIRTRCLLVALTALLMTSAAANSAIADTITLAWDPTTGVAGYMVHVGTVSGSYTQHLDVGLTSTYGWSSAVAGTRYCFAVSAYNTSHLEGPKSNEVCGYSNAPPVLVNPGARSSSVGQPTSLQLQGSDPDGLPVSYTASGMPPGLSLGVGTGFISGTPTTVGTYTVTAAVSDGVLNSSPQSFAWTIAAASGGDTSVPSVTITGPTSASTYSTTASAMSLSGTASDNVGVTQVTWVNDRGGSGSASGTTSWSVGNIALATGTNTITVTARDSAGNTAIDSITVTYSTTTSGGSVGTPSGTGTGLLGQYYSGTAFGSLLTTRVDPTVNFTWGGGSPGTSVPTDNFSVRWTGTVVAPVSGTYYFTTVSDDGVRLWVNNQLLVDNWTAHAAMTNTSIGVTLQAGQAYPVKLEYFEASGEATIQLQWAYPGQANQTIPQTALLPPGSTSSTGSTGGTSTGGTGLRGDYYSGTSFSALLTTRVDPTVNFSWSTGSPGTSLPADNFSVRWTGTIVAPVSGTYYFTTMSDDGVRLWVNNQSLIDNWTAHAATGNTSVGVSLVAGQAYPIRLEYFEATGEATIQLQWTYPGQANQTIPQSALMPATGTSSGGGTSTTGTGLRGEYYNDTSFATLLTTRVDPTVNFNWGNGSAGTNLPADNFSVRWTGTFVAPVSGTYSFSTVSDDGVRLWVNNQQVINNWAVHPATTDTSVAVTLQAGQSYPIRLEYFEGSGQATIQLRWTVPGQATQVIPQSALTP